MKIIPIKQNSEEWEAFRRTKIGASDCPAICGVDPYKKPEKLFNQKFTGEKQYETPAMRRGKELEPKARELMSKAMGKCYLPVVGQHEEFDWMIASFDGFDISTKDIIEIKCPSEKTFNEIVLERKIPKQYIYQMQHQMFVAELEECLLIPFNGLYFEEIVIERDEDIIQELFEKERHFYQCMLEGEYKKP